VKELMQNASAQHQPQMKDVKPIDDQRNKVAEQLLGIC
jgi:hypothetical protein